MSPDAIGHLIKPKNKENKMLKNRNIKMFVAIVLIFTVILVTLSAVYVPSPVSEDLSASSKQDISDRSEQALVPVTNNQENEVTPVLELAAKTNFTAEIKEEIRAGNNVNPADISYIAPEKDGDTVGPYEFKFLQWESSQSDQ